MIRNKTTGKCEMTCTLIMLIKKYILKAKSNFTLCLYIPFPGIYESYKKTV